MQKFYFHDATTTVGGTLPGASSQSATTPNVTAAGASTNRTMDDTIGTSQVSQALTTLAQSTAQKNWFRRFVSPPVAAQTISTGSWNIHWAASDSSSNSALIGSSVLYLWRPSSGALVGSLIYDVFASGSFTGQTETAQTLSARTGGSVTAVDGDVLCCEIWGTNTQSMSTAYTNTFFYDGTSEDSAASNAGYLLAPADLPLYVASPTPDIAMGLTVT